MIAPKFAPHYGFHILREDAEAQNRRNRNAAKRYRKAQRNWKQNRQPEPKWNPGDTFSVEELQKVEAAMRRLERAQIQGREYFFQSLEVRNHKGNH
jgi:hypothetical protein